MKNWSYCKNAKKVRGGVWSGGGGGGQGGYKQRIIVKLQKSQGGLAGGLGVWPGVSGLI